METIATREQQIRRAAARFEADPASLREAFERAQQSMGKEVRLCRKDDRPGKSSCSVRFTQGTRGEPGFLLHCFRTGKGGFFRLIETSGLSSAERRAVGEQRASISNEIRARQERDRIEKEKVASTIAHEGLSPEEAHQRHGRSGRHDYASAKGLVGFRSRSRPKEVVPPCPALRYAARSYALRGQRLLFAGTPFWMVRDCDNGEVCGVQFKFWSQKDAAWNTRTIGRTGNAWIELPPQTPTERRHASQYVVLAEGISTAWALHQMLDGEHVVIATLGIAGLGHCAKRAARQYPDLLMAIVADLDRTGQGERAAFAAAHAVGGRVLLPLPLGTASSEISSSRERGFDAWNLWARLGGASLEGGLDALISLGVA